MQQLKRATHQGVLAINSVIYAELSIGYAEIEQLDHMIKVTGLSLEPISRSALFLAGKAFYRYRTATGTKKSVLPDFFIGAHATVAQIPLLTRDMRRYRTYFPNLVLITPET